MDTSTDSVRQLIRDTLLQRHLNMSAVSKMLGKNHAYLHQFLDRRIPAQLPELVRGQLADILGVPEEKLRGGGGKGSPTPRPGSRWAPPMGGDKIPVYGAAQGGPDGWFPWNGEAVEYVSRPPHLAGAIEPFAVYVAGSSMEPRYYAGEIVYIHPGKPATIGAFVLVEVKPESEGEAPRAFIKRLVRRTATKATFEQFNPPKEFDIKMSEVKSIRRIVGTAESGGL
jgi:SOS-response transcriptional repressor LexA